LETRLICKFPQSYVGWLVHTFECSCDLFAGWPDAFVKKIGPKILSTSVIYQKIVKSKQSPNRRKFVQSGHPACLLDAESGWPDWANSRPIGRLFTLVSFLKNPILRSPIFWATFSHGLSCVLISTKKCWTTFWATFSQAQQVTLAETNIFFELYCSASQLFCSLRWNHRMSMETSISPESD
jgi:hypothetical protein